MTERTPLLAALSDDNGKSFPHRCNIAEGPGSFAYPVAIQTQDGAIHVVYTSHKRTVINRAIFDEDWFASDRPGGARLRAARQPPSLSGEIERVRRLTALHTGARARGARPQGERARAGD